MSDDYQIRKDIDRAKTFLDNLEYVLQTEYNLTANDIKDLFKLYYDKSEVYNKSEVYSKTQIDERMTTWVKSTRTSGIVLYRQRRLQLCELQFNIVVDTLPEGETRLTTIPSDYAPNEYVISPVKSHNDIVVMVGVGNNVRAYNYGSEQTDIRLRATLFWRY